MMGRVMAAVAAVWLAATGALAAPTLDDYGRLPAIEMVEMSPSGMRYALVETVNDVRRIRVLDLADKSRAMADRLRAQKKPVEYMTLKDEDHWLSRSETRAAMLKASVAFVEKHNPAR